MIPSNFPLLQMEKLSPRQESSQSNWGTVAFLLQELEKSTQSENTDVWEDHHSQQEVCLREQVHAGKSQRWWDKE